MGIILKWVLQEHNETLRTEILWPRIGFSLSLLWKIFSRYDSGDSVVTNCVVSRIRAGRSGGISGRKRDFLFSKFPRPAVVPTQSPLRNRVFARGKAAWP